MDENGEHLFKEKWRSIWRPFVTSQSSQISLRKYAPLLDNILSIQSQFECHSFRVPSNYPIDSEGMKRYAETRNIGILANEKPERKERERGGEGEEREGGVSLFRVPTNEEYKTPDSFEGIFYTNAMSASSNVEGGSKLILCIHGGPHRFVCSAS